MKSHKGSGFTLMEVIVSVFIMSIIVMIVLPVFASIMESADSMEKKGIRQTREAQALMSMIRADLKAAFVSTLTGDNKFLMLNINDLDGKSRDEIYFTSFNYQTAEGLGNYSDQCEIGYYVKDSDEKNVLYKKISRTIDEDLVEGGREFKLTDSIEYFDLVAYKSGDITGGDFDSELEENEITTFPAGILVRVGLIGDDGKVRAYETAFVMPPYKIAVEKKDGESEDEENVEGNDAATEEEGNGKDDTTGK